MSRLAMVAMVGCLSVGVLSASLTAQNGQPSFEVAIIKTNLANNQGVRGGCRASDTRLAANDDRASVPLGRCVVTAGALRHLMAIAFDLPLNRISGFPGWDASSRFDLEGKAEDPAAVTHRQLLTMLQTFLIEEFKLTVHRETKDVPTFALVVARNGPKHLHPSDQASCSMTPQPAGLGFKGCSIADFANFLSTVPAVQRPVMDTTGVSGRYDFTVEVGSKLQDVAGAKIAMLAWDSIFSDVQDQLGLRFDRSTGPIETLVIDRAELPTEK